MREEPALIERPALLKFVQAEGHRRRHGSDSDPEVINLTGRLRPFSLLVAPVNVVPLILALAKRHGFLNEVRLTPTGIEHGFQGAVILLQSFAGPIPESTELFIQTAAALDLLLKRSGEQEATIRLLEIATLIAAAKTLGYPIFTTQTTRADFRGHNLNDSAIHLI